MGCRFSQAMPRDRNLRSSTTVNRQRESIDREIES